MISIENLSHCYEDHWVLKGNHFKVSAGKTVGLLGPNGSGKTTLLKILATLLNPTQGKGQIGPFDLRSQVPQVRKNLHWLGHDSGLYAPLTARENLEFFCRIQGIAPDSGHLNQALAEVGLSKFSSLQTAAFSAGMKKRLAMAKLLLKKVSLILLDEPHTNLDKSGRELMDSLIVRWKKEGVTLLLASHEESIVRPLCDIIMILEDGRILSQEGEK